MSVLLTRMPKATSAELTKNEENILLLKQNKSIRCKIDKPWEQASEKKKDRLLGLSAELHFPNMGGGNESKRTTPAGRQQLSVQHRKHSYPLSLRSQHLERWQYWKRFKECASSWTPCGKWSPKTYPAYKSGLQWMLPLQRNRLKSPYKDFYICKFHSHSSSKALQLLCVFSL